MIRYKIFNIKDLSGAPNYQFAHYEEYREKAVNNFIKKNEVEDIISLEFIDADRWDGPPYCRILYKTNPNNKESDE